MTVSSRLPTSSSTRQSQRAASVVASPTTRIDSHAHEVWRAHTAGRRQAATVWVQMEALAAHGAVGDNFRLCSEFLAFAACHLIKQQ